MKTYKEPIKRNLSHLATAKINRIASRQERPHSNKPPKIAQTNNRITSAFRIHHKPSQTTTDPHAHSAETTSRTHLPTTAAINRRALHKLAKPQNASGHRCCREESAGFHKSRGNDSYWRGATPTTTGAVTAKQK